MDPSPQHLSPQQLPPALVAFLLQDGRVTGEVFSRTLLSLADDGWLRIEPQDSGGVPIVRITRLPAPHEAKQFEHLALERVVHRMGTLTHVPLSALTSSEGADYDPWWKRFGEAVNAEAEQYGLTKHGLHPRTSCGLPLLLALAAGFAVAGPGGLSSIAGVGVGFAVLMLTLIAVGKASRPRLTEQGKTAAAWWRERGSGLGGSVLADQLPPGAQPSPHSTEAIVAQGAAPLPDGHVWSSYGGQWRTIKVGPLDVTRWGRPGRGIMLGVLDAFFTLPLLGVSSRLPSNATGLMVKLAPTVIFGSLLLFVWLPAYRRSLAVPKRGAFTGQVVKRWTYESGGEDSTTYYCCCLDDGASPEGWSFRIERSVYSQLRVGDVVYVDFNPRRHKINQLQPAAPVSSPSPTPRP